MGLLPLTYTRPKRVDQRSYRSNSASSSGDSLSDGEKTDGSVNSGFSGFSSGIPDSLAFDKIIDGGTCPVSLPIPAGSLPELLLTDFNNSQ